MAFKTLFLSVSGILVANATALAASTKGYNPISLPERLFEVHKGNITTVAANIVYPGLPITSPEAIHPETYSSLGISWVPGFFRVDEAILPKGNTSVGITDNCNLQFDRHYIVSLHPELFNDQESQYTSSSYNEDHMPPSKKWEALRNAIQQSNDNFMKKGDSTRYKVLFLARHGQGYHNFAGTKYAENNGWECYWAMQAGDEEATWGPDAKLTPLGIQEAKLKGQIWRKHIEDGAPIPEKHFVSPLSRSIRTMEETWKDVYGWLGNIPHPQAPEDVRPVVKEILRETISLHFSDHRSPLTYLHDTYPYLFFSPIPTVYTQNKVSFPNDDPYWTFHRESIPMRNHRIKTALQEVIAESGDATYIGITAHWGVIESALTALNHSLVPLLETTGVIPVVVKVEPGADTGVNGVGSWYERRAKQVSPPLEFRAVCPGKQWGSVWVQGKYSDEDGGIGLE